MEEEEVSDEQYASINALIDRMLQNEAGLMRAIEQANTLVSWSKAHDYQLFSQMTVLVVTCLKMPIWISIEALYCFL